MIDYLRSFPNSLVTDKYIETEISNKCAIKVTSKNLIYFIYNSDSYDKRTILSTVSRYEICTYNEY